MNEQSKGIAHAGAASDELLPCPFCGMKPPQDLIDTLYPSGRWREDDGLRHYLLPSDEREGHGQTWGMHCTQNIGGCGARISGDSKAEAIAAWNRRALAAPAATQQPTLPQPIPDALHALIDAAANETGTEEPFYAALAVISKHVAALSGVAPAPQPELTDERITELGHRHAWRYKHSSDPNHSHTYTFNGCALHNFARAIEREVRSMLSGAPAQAVQQPTARMLTMFEVLHAVDNHHIFETDAQSIQRKFCEINSIHLAAGDAGQHSRGSGEAEDAKDAARYRWLRARRYTATQLLSVTLSSKLDAAIDAAMAAASSGKEKSNG